MRLPPKVSTSTALATCVAWLLTVPHDSQAIWKSSVRTSSQLLPAADAIAEQVREYLIRVIRRHGPFENEAAALDFIAVGLQRAERRLDRERLVAKERPRLDSGARMAPHGI